MAMTVAELIAELKKYPDYSLVYFETQAEEDESVDAVYLDDQSEPRHVFLFSK